MKVVLLTGSNSRNSGGLYNSVRNLGQALIKLGNTEPILLGHNDNYSTQDITAYAPMKTEEYKLIGPSKFGYSDNIFKKLIEINPDILHPQCVWMYLSYVNNKYHRKYNVPYVISPRGMLDQWILNNGQWKKKAAALLYENRNLKEAACINALCIPEYKSIRNYGIQNPVAIIPNGVNLPKSQIKDKINLPDWKGNDNRKILLFLSRLHTKKGIENLLYSWARISSYKKEWKLAIAGETNDGDYFQSLQALKSKLNLNDDCFFIGPQFHEEKDICFRCADAFILPSFSEGLPMAVLEAWSYKLPVLITEACNIPEGFEKQAAIKIAPEADSILAGLEQLFKLTDEERAYIGKRGYNLVLEKFTWDSIAKQTEELYNWVLHGGKAPYTVQFS